MVAVGAPDAEGCVAAGQDRQTSSGTGDVAVKAVVCCHGIGGNAQTMPAARQTLTARIMRCSRFMVISRLEFYLAFKYSNSALMYCFI